MIPIKDNYKFGTDPTMDDQTKRTNNWIYKKKIQPWSPFGARAQRIETLSLYSSRWALKIAISIPTQAGQRFTWPKTWYDRQQLWKAVITGDTVTRLSIPIRGRG